MQPNKKQEIFYICKKKINNNLIVNRKETLLLRFILFLFVNRKDDIVFRIFGKIK
jgi:hypothetical protein